MPAVAPLESPDQLRRQMAVSSRRVYLDHAAVAPLPRCSARSIVAWAEDLCADGSAHWSQWRRRVEQTRSLLAKLISASPDEVAIIRNTTEGVALVAEGWRWQPGDSVVVPQCEFPANLYPWLNLRERGVCVRTVDVRSDADNEEFCRAIERACDESTQIIACSWVDYSSGRRRDLSRLCEIAHSRGARLFVDAIQGLGVLPLDVADVPVDFLAADGHKWLLGPEGAGVCFVRSERLNDLRVIGPGWNSVRHAGDFANKDLDLKPSASRCEAGTSNISAIVGLHASLVLLSGIARAAAERRLLEIRAWFAEAGCRSGLRTAVMPDAELSGIIAFDSPRLEARQLARELRRCGVIVSARDGRLRVSPHLYNNLDDAAQFGEAVQSF